MKLAILHTFILSVLTLAVFGQSQKQLENQAQKNYIIEQSIEILAENLENEDADFQTLLDILSIYYEKPINLNRKDIKEDLLQLMLLTEFQIENLLSHIDKNGKLISIYELQSIPGFDTKTIRNIMPFVAVNTNFESPHTSVEDLFKNATNELFIRYSRVLEEQRGFSEISDEDWQNSPNSRYLGQPDRLYMRYRFKYLTNLSVGFTMEKDPGETMFGNKRAEELHGIKTNKGFDFYSAHFFIKDVGRVKALAVGDFQAQFGQGLTFWSGLSFGKSINILTAKKNAPGLRPYTSVDENLFLRGAGVTLGVMKNFEFTAFGSSKKIDANITNSRDTTDGSVENIAVSSFQATGSHATIRELENKHAIQENIAGGRFAFVSRRVNVGLIGSHTTYGGDLERNLSTYNQFQFNSNSNTVVGVDYSVIHKNFNFFGEAARSANGGTGLVSGVLASLSTNISFTALYRNYSRDFQNLKSIAFAESSTNVNEKGVYLGFDGKVNRNWTISAYMDQFEFPWMRFRNNSVNTYGYDGILQIRYKPNRSLDMYGRIRMRNRPIDTQLPVSDIPYIAEAQQNNYRFNVVYKISPAVRLQSRVEYVTYERGGGQKENGFLVFQDINVNPLSSKFSFSFRYAIFDTESFNTRFYAYENDVLYFFAIPAYANRGTRTYLTARYKASKTIDIWLRYGQWFYNNVETIGSGLNQIEGNTKSEVRALLVLRF